MRPTLALLTPPGLDPVVSLPQRLEPVYIQALPSHRRIERFHVRMVRRRAWSREVDGDLVVIGPKVHQLTPELTPVVTAEPSRRASMDFEPIHHRDDVLAAKTLAHPMATHSRVYTSMTVRARHRRPSTS